MITQAELARRRRRIRQRVRLALVQRRVSAIDSAGTHPAGTDSGGGTSGTDAPADPSPDRAGRGTQPATQHSGRGDDPGDRDSLAA